MKKRLTTLSAIASASLAIPANAATITYRNLILSDNPVVYYEFDETSGTTAINSAATGSGQNGILNGTITVAQASAQPFLGAAYDFGGGYITAASIANTLSEWTMEAWIRYSDAGDATVLSNDQSGWNDDVIIGINPEGGLSGVGAGEFGISQQSAPGGPRDGVGAPIDADTWYHVALTGSTSDSVMSVYIDGMLIASDTSPNVNFDFGTSGGIFIGGKRSNGTSLFDGLIDELAIYDSVLSASDLAARANFNPIPEPSTMLLGGISSLLLLRRKRESGQIGF